MLRKFIRVFGGDPNKREIENLSEIVEQINALEDQYGEISDEALRAKTDEFRNIITDRTRNTLDESEQRQQIMDVLDELLPEAFAAVRKPANGQSACAIMMCS